MKCTLTPVRLSPLPRGSLVRAARGSSQIVSVGLDVCEDVWLSFTFLKNACTYVHETLHTAFLCLSPEAY